jgi:[FeFe] hydrogenase H-cluster maturation GTPase HydF
LINALSGQDTAIVSDVAGTTTDLVKKSIEIEGIGPVILLDTAGIDDVGELGLKRVAKTNEALKIIDLAILVITNNTISEPEIELIDKFEDLKLPWFTVHNKADLAIINEQTIDFFKQKNKEIISFSTIQKTNLDEIILKIQKYIPESAYKISTLIGDIMHYGDTVLLITPIDIEAPEGRLILPQVQVIRDILDNDGIAMVIKEREIDTYLSKMSPKPALVITDSQVFLKADAAIPKDIPLTSFSIILARQKGDFSNYIKGTPHIDNLKDGDKILILESCTHHVSCDDIGRVKIPRWLTNYTGKKLEFTFVTGLDKLPNIHDYSMVIQCGGCMITRKQVLNRLKPAIDAGIPISNYGMAIAYCHGIYHRAVAPFLKSEINVTDYL